MSFIRFIRSHIGLVILMFIPFMLYHRIYSGDEPHYFIIASSIAKDFDLDLSNNYRNARSGSSDAGLRFRYRKIDHHSFYFNPQTAEKSFWQPADSLKSGSPKDQLEDRSSLKEYSHHPIGMPVLASPVYFLFRANPKVEFFVLFQSFLVAVIGMFFLYKILSQILDEGGNALILCFFMFGTPIWQYSRNFYTEAYTWPLLAAAIYYLFFRERYFIAGLLMGIAILVRYTMGLFSFVFLIYLILGRKRNGLVSYLLGFFPFVLAQLLLMLNSTTDVLGYSATDIIKGLFLMPKALIYIFFDPGHGIFMFSPFLVFSLLGWSYVYRKNRELFLLTLSLLVAYLFCSGISMANFNFVTGHCYAYRYFIVLLPVLMIPTAYWHRENKKNFYFGFLALFSIVINLFSVVKLPPYVWGVPVIKLLGL